MRHRRENRLRFLHALSTRAGADVGAYEDVREIADQPGIPVDEAERITRYHEEHGFLQHLAGGGLVLRITAAGVDHIELRGEHA